VLVGRSQLGGNTAGCSARITKQPCTLAPSVMRMHEPPSHKTLLEIGFWADTHSGGRGPDPRLLVDPTWARADRGKLVDYLDSGLTWEAYLGFSYCRFNCGIRREEMGAATLTDGSWAWPQGLAHYVAEHKIALPDQFLEHARAQRFQIDAQFASPAMPGGSRWLAFPAYGTSEPWQRWAVERKAMAP
jgi:hypothetical protein